MSTSIQARGLARAYARGRKVIREQNMAQRFYARHKPEQCPLCNWRPPREVAITDILRDRTYGIYYCAECAEAAALIGIESTGGVLDALQLSSSPAVLRACLKLELNGLRRPVVLIAIESRIRSIMRRAEQAKGGI